MNLDFALILVIATALSGIDLGDRCGLFRWPPREADSPVRPAPQPVIVDYARSFFPILLAVLVIRSFLFEPFRIPSSSMVPTLLIGDFIFVNKFTYGLRLPVVNTKIVQVGEPQRGDVVVFQLPSEPSTNYIKRLVGLPGDVVKYVNKRLYINDEPVDVELVGPYEGEGQQGATLLRETLGDREHDLLLMPRQRSLEGTFIGARGALLHDGRQPGQQPGQPLPRRRADSGQEDRRQGGAHLDELGNPQDAALEPHR